MRKWKLWLSGLWLLSLLAVPGLGVSIVGADVVQVTCDPDALVKAMQGASKKDEPVTLELTEACTYQLYKINNEGDDGDNGLPQIISGQTLTINGNGSTISRKDHDIPTTRAIPTGKDDPSPDSAESVEFMASADHPMFRFFQVNKGGKLTLNNVTLSKGLNWKTYKEEGGGAVANWGTLTVRNCTFANNTAGCGGAISHEEGTLTVVRSEFYFNAGER